MCLAAVLLPGAQQPSEAELAEASCAAVSEAELKSATDAMAKVKVILQKVYASLGEEFVDGEEFDGAVVRGAIKRSILIAMKS